MFASRVWQASSCSAAILGEGGHFSGSLLPPPSRRHGCPEPHGERRSREMLISEQAGKCPSGLCKHQQAPNKLKHGKGS